MSASIQSAQATLPVLAPRILEPKLAAPKSLRWAVAVTVLSALLAIGIGLAGVFYLKQQQTKFSVAKNAKADAQARLNNAALELSGLNTAQPSYDKLRAKGIFVAESRITFIEALNSLQQQHKLSGLEYTIEPQRPLVLADGRNYPAIELLASRINFIAQAEHDAELLAFIGAFAQLNRGIFPLQQCRIARNAPPPRARFSENNAATQNAAVGVASTAAFTARCALDWITLRDKTAAIETAVGNKPSTTGEAQK